jgi:tRNA threonylcarbamoyladenosine biosynthesis protein TsaE
MIVTTSPEETKALGRRIAAALEGGENLLLVGDLGSGKTAFVQGLAEGFGLEEPVKSPTFTYLREYQLPRRSTRLAHFDLYRLPDKPTQRDLESIELLERLGDEDTITVVEWADKLKRSDHGNQFVLEFSVRGDSEREINLPETLRKSLPS